MTEYYQVCLCYNYRTLHIFIGKNTDGKPFFISFLNRLLCFMHNILSHFSNIHFYSHFSSQQRWYALMIFIVENINARLVYIQRV